MKLESFLFAFPNHESPKRQRAFWEAFEVDYKKMREEGRELESRGEAIESRGYYTRIKNLHKTGGGGGFEG